MKQLWNDRDGAILPYVAIMLVVIFGLSALAVDASRLMTMQTQLQASADALALAGAAELDRRPDSIIRAEAAIHDLVVNPIPAAGLGKVAEVSRITFLRSLPPDDELPITTSNLTEDPTLAGYVQVAVRPVGMAMIFPISLSPNRRTISVGAQSIAGYDQIVCHAAPVFVCNPFETPGMTYFQATQALLAGDKGSHSRLIKLARSQFKNGGFSAGDIGYVRPTTGYLPENACGPVGESGIPQALAATQVQACFRLSGIHSMASDDQPAMDGLNTRFDLYANGFYNCRGYPPDLNVRKGYISLNNSPNWCDNGVPASPIWPLALMPGAASALPPDQNMVNQSLNPNVVVGSGVWDCDTYWRLAHAVGPGRDTPPPGCTHAATITRYSVYQYELNFLNDRSLGVEYGGPRCVPMGVANRRIITTAIVNCGSSPVPVLNDTPGVPVAGFGRFFLVWPAEAGTADGDPYAEFLGLVKRSDPISTDMVQLYR